MNPSRCCYKPCFLPQNNPLRRKKHSFTVQETFLTDAKNTIRPAQKTQCRKKHTPTEANNTRTRCKIHSHIFATHTASQRCWNTHLREKRTVTKYFVPIHVHQIQAVAKSTLSQKTPTERSPNTSRLKKYRRKKHWFPSQFKLTDAKPFLSTTVVQWI